MALPDRRIDTLRIRMPSSAGDRAQAARFGEAVARDIAQVLGTASRSVHARSLDLPVRISVGAPWQQIVPRIASAARARLGARLKT